MGTHHDERAKKRRRHFGPILEKQDHVVGFGPSCGVVLTKQLVLFMLAKFTLNRLSLLARWRERNMFFGQVRWAGARPRARWAGLIDGVLGAASVSAHNEGGGAAAPRGDIWSEFKNSIWHTIDFSSAPIEFDASSSVLVHVVSRIGAFCPSWLIELMVDLHMVRGKVVCC